MAEGFALVGVGIVAAVAVIEVVGRLVWVDPNVSGPLPTPPPGVRVFKRPFEIKSRNVAGFFQGVPHVTNRHGFRGRNYSNVPGKGVFRIVLVGDSVAMGQSVEFEDIYSNVLERMLNQRSDGLNYEVLNLGVSGWNIGKIVDRLTELGIGLQPHLIVYGCTINDIEGPDYRRSFSKLAIHLQARRLEWFDDSPSYLVRLAWPRIQSLRDLLTAPKGSHLFEVLDNYFDNPKAWQTFAGGLTRLGRVQTAERPVVLFQHSSLYYLNSFHPFRRVYDKIQQAAEAEGLTVIQSFEALRGKDARSMWVAAMDPHPNAVAHRLLAEALYVGLDSKNLLERDP